MNSPIEELNREKTNVARISVLSNLMLVILKLGVGTTIGSVSVISEAIHSGIDLIAAVIAYFSVRSSSKPPDQDHKFGHGKMENISGTIEAILIFIAAGMIILEAYDKFGRISRGEVIQDVSLGIVIMLISTAVNFFVSRKLMQAAKRTESIALEADALHLRTDVLTSFGIFAGLVAIKLTGFAILDPIFAILVALFILKAALDLTIKSARDLMDVHLPPEEERDIENIIKDHSQQFVGFHELRTRRSGSDRFIDLHLVVSRELSIEQAHNLADHIENDIKGRFPRCSVIIHVEPCDNGDHCDICMARECSKSHVQPEE
ncbi:MAG TPA: cation diffusion facilitator family transporter [Methanocella sp.]|nr:cation diffusion facilitator family transporter [Methanocella sp.]